MVWRGHSICRQRSQAAANCTFGRVVCTAQAKRVPGCPLVPRRSSLGSLGEHLNKTLIPTLTLLGSCGTFKGWGLVGVSGVMGSVLSEGIAGLSAFLFPTIRGMTATALPNHRPELQNSEPGKAVPPVRYLGSDLTSGHPHGFES